MDRSHLDSYTSAEDVYVDPDAWVDGMVKKKDRIPADMLKRMRGYQRDVESRPGR